MRVAQSELFQIAEAIRHKRRYLHLINRKPNFLKKLAVYLDAAFFSLVRDKYGIIHKDVLIIGSDALINCVAAYILGVKGFSSLIVQEQLSPEDIRSGRYSMNFSTLDNTIRGLLALDGDYAETILATLVRNLEQLQGGDGTPLVEQLQLATLRYMSSSDTHHFWVDQDMGATQKLGVHCVEPWGISSSKKVISRGSYPFFRAEFKSVILTSSSLDSLVFLSDLKPMLVGDALKPLSTFEYFRASDRFIDVVDTIKALLHVQDLPLASQHNAGL